MAMVEVKCPFCEGTNVIKNGKTVVEIIVWDEVESCELDKMWSFVQNKRNQRWLWLGIDHESRAVLAFTFGKRKDKVFKQFQLMLKPFGITVFGYVRQWRNIVSIFNPNSKILITNPITISCIKTDLEKQMVFRHSLFMRVLKVRFLRSILWVFALPITWFSGCILRS